MLEKIYNDANGHVVEDEEFYLESESCSNSDHEDHDHGDNHDGKSVGTYRRSQSLRSKRGTSEASGKKKKKEHTATSLLLMMSKAMH